MNSINASLEFSQYSCNGISKKEAKKSNTNLVLIPGGTVSLAKMVIIIIQSFIKINFKSNIKATLQRSE